jgi:hypothetical protein
MYTVGVSQPEWRAAALTIDFHLELAPVLHSGCDDTNPVTTRGLCFDMCPWCEFHMPKWVGEEGVFCTDEKDFSRGGRF